MAKRKVYYAKGDNGKWAQINKVPDHSIEQLSFDFDISQETAEKLSDNKEMEFTFTSQIEPTEAVGQLFDDNIYEALLDEIDKLRTCWLNAMYYIDHATTRKDIFYVDKVTRAETQSCMSNIHELLDYYKDICQQEYNQERDSILKEMAKNMN